MGSPEHKLATYSKQPTNTGSTESERERNRNEKVSEQVTCRFFTFTNASSTTSLAYLSTVPLGRMPWAFIFPPRPQKGQPKPGDVTRPVQNVLISWQEPGPEAGHLSPILVLFLGGGGQL